MMHMLRGRADHRCRYHRRRNGDHFRTGLLLLRGVIRILWLLTHL